MIKRTEWKVRSSKCMSAFIVGPVCVCVCAVMLLTPSPVCFMSSGFISGPALQFQRSRQRLRLNRPDIGCVSEIVEGEEHKCPVMGVQECDQKRC